MALNNNLGKTEDTCPEAEIQRLALLLFFFNITYLLKLLHFLSACRGTSASGNMRLYLDTSDADDSSITFFLFIPAKTKAAVLE